MPSVLNAHLRSAVTLAALLLLLLLLPPRASGAPLADALTDNPAGDPSGEEETEMSSDRLSALPIWDTVIRTIERHLSVFEGELRSGLTYFPDISSLPEECPKSNFSKEACLHRLVQGLLTYRVILRHVEEQYRGSSIPSEVNQIPGGLSNLINVVKSKMRKPEQVTALTSSQEEQLLRDMESPDIFQRKMTSLSVLQKLRIFLIGCKRAINKKELARRDAAPVTFYYQS